MTDPKPAPPRDDAELVARIEVATRPAPGSPHDHARLRERALARALQRKRARVAWRWAFAGALVCAALAAGVWSPAREAAPSAAPSGREAAALGDSFEEQMLFAPEWIERDAGFVDEELLPESYALASALLDS